MNECRYVLCGSNGNRGGKQKKKVGNMNEGEIDDEEDDGKEDEKKEMN